jgi:malto-oligosyltrehalose trehalohydrolase
VVYNHFGPDGAYFHDIAPSVWTERHQTPWGAAINFDGPESHQVREFFIHNALYWIEEFNLDGLRLDAVHAIIDESPTHFLTELAERVRTTSGKRHVHLLLENEDNQAHWLTRSSDQAYLFTAQWNDDVHHVLHVAATGEANGYYDDYRDDADLLGRALAEGFAYQGEMMPYRSSPRGEPSGHLPPVAFVSFIQNHDQVGNRAFGDRISSVCPPKALRAIAATYLLLPQIPMLFMGEEWAAAQPFPFFCAFEGDLAKAVRDGRRQEFARFPEFSDPITREKIPDPIAEETFMSAKLAWNDLAKREHAEALSWYRRILDTRHTQIVPLLGQIRSAGKFRVVAKNAQVVRWSLDTLGAELVWEGNLTQALVPGFEPVIGQEIWHEGDTADRTALGAWSVRWTLVGTGIRA